LLEKILVNQNRLWKGSPCWEWQAFRNDGGYGRLHGLGETYAHRVSYVYFIGKIPEGTEIDHECENPPCVNPLHLQAVTHAKNLSYYTRTHCAYGHEYTHENSHRTRRGELICKACRYRRIKEWRERNPEKAREVYRRDKRQYRAKGGI